ncbi:Nucleoporin Nup43 [Thelohanellus kitauei]|uniref:Nucleoporin Nup43 n=1 Tax=Thelohanellus kitauei TaxID=669202 RepID=A0A0C2M548_THEKT|nr:Nucleoporin Nup43 [Thelohanellus kitauei]
MVVTIKQTNHAVPCKISCLAYQNPEGSGREKYLCYGTYNSPNISSNWLNFAKIDNNNTLCILDELHHEAEIFFEPQSLLMLDRTGSVTVLKLTEKFNVISEFSPKTLGLYRETMRSVDRTTDNLILGAGAIGNVYLNDLSQQKLVSKFANVSSTALRTINSLQNNTFLVGNIGGQVKLCDAVIGSDCCVKMFRLKGDLSGVYSVAPNPNDEHNFLAGYEDGSIRVWDSRKEEFPISKLNVHEGSVNKIMFSRRHIHVVYSCCSKGRMLMLDPGTEKVENIWSKISAYEHEMKATELNSCGVLPINTLDNSENQIIAGGDAQYLFQIELNY